MPRPKTDRRPVGMRLSLEAVAALDAGAARMKMTRTAYVELLAATGYNPAPSMKAVAPVAAGKRFSGPIPKAKNR